jgi:carboxyl-terminal processing protease
MHKQNIILFMRQNFIASIILCSLVFSVNANAIFKSESNDRYYDKFKKAFEKIQKEYVNEPKKQELIDAAIDGMLSSLDPHSVFLADEDYDFFMSSTIGEFGGIGAEITYETGAVKIISPIDGLGAYKAGVKAGDFIVKINKDFVNNLGFNKAVSELRGEPGSKVNITVIREGEVKPLDFEITREIVKIDAIKSRIDNNIAYIRVSTFNEKSSSDLRKEFRKIFSDKNNKIEGIVLDLRNNPGGLLDQGVNIADFFLDEGTIVSTKGRNISSEILLSASKNSYKAPNLPMVVLINGGSASASEIVAGALQDNKRAILVGTKTYGKGSVQTLFKFDERSALKFTTALYYTPSGKSIQAEGIDPDIKIENAKAEYSANSKDRLRFSEASLKNHIKNEKESNKEPKDSKKSIDDKKDSKNDSKKEDDEKDNLSEEYKSDFQYARAYDILQGLIISEKRNERRK